MATSAAAFETNPLAGEFLAYGRALSYPLHCTARFTESSAMRYVVIAFIVVIVLSLGSAMFYLIRDKGTSDRTVKALTIRVALSITLFVLLMLGHYFGIIPKTGL
ncbi:MAG: twin transmembrane helix small protein [Betaproteobacteria bacterium]